MVDGTAKEAASGQSDEVPDRVRWQTSLPHLVRRTTERRAAATAQWVRDHVRSERRYHPPGGSGFRRRALRRVWNATTQRCYQLLSGHAAIGSFLHDRMTGPQRLESDECWWCNCGRRQSPHHSFVECRAGAPQIRELWQRIEKDCGWEHPRAPALRWLWKDDAVGAVVDFLKTRVGSRGRRRWLELGQMRTGRGTRPWDRRATRTGLARLRVCSLLSFVFSLCPLVAFLLSGGLRGKETGSLTHSSWG